MGEDGRFGLDCHKWLKEKDPMAPQDIPEGWVEGHIVLENTENGYRHYVRGVPIHAGSAIHVKLGDGWIAGRYEWSFDSKSSIRIHSGDDVIYVNQTTLIKLSLKIVARLTKDKASACTESTPLK